MLFGGNLQIDAKNSNFEIFESALNMKSVSMPLKNFLKVEKWRFFWKDKQVTFISEIVYKMVQ